MGSIYNSLAACSTLSSLVWFTMVGAQFANRDCSAGIGENMAELCLSCTAKETFDLELVACLPPRVVP